MVGVLEINRIKVSLNPEERAQRRQKLFFL